MTTSREKFYYTRTLCCLLKALEGVETEIELRNESHVKGTVEFVSGAMGVTMLNCELIVAGRMKKLQRLFVQGRKIRMVVVPDDINMIDAMQRVINMFNAPVLGRNEFKKRSVGRGRGEGRGRGISYRGKSGGGFGRARGRARGGVPWGAPAGDAGRGQVYGRGRGSSDGGEAGRGQVFGRGSGSRIGGDAGRGQVGLFGCGRDSDAIIADIGTSQVYEHGSGSLSSGARRGGDFGQGSGVRGMHIGTGTGRTERDQTQNQSDSDNALGSLHRPDYMSQQVPAGHAHSQALPQVQVPSLSSAVGSMLCPDYMNPQVPAGHSHSQTLPHVQVPSLSSTASCASPESSQSWTDLRQKIQGNKNLQEGSRHKSHMMKESLSGRPCYSSSEGGESHKKHSRKSLTPVSSKHQIASSSRSETSRGERDSVKLKDRLSQLRHSDKHHDYPKRHTHVSHTTHRRASSSGEAKHSHSCRTRTESSERGDYDRHAEKYHGQTESERHDSRSRSRISPGRDGSHSSSSRGGSPGQDECKFVRDQGKYTRRSSPTSTSMSREHHKSSRRSLRAGDRPKSTRLSPARDQSASSRRRSSARDEFKSKRSDPARD